MVGYLCLVISEPRIYNLLDLTPSLIFAPALMITVVVGCVKCSKYVVVSVTGRGSHHHPDDQKLFEFHRPMGGFVLINGEWAEVCVVV